MILKIVNEKGTVLGAVNVYENNENGEVFVKETHRCKAEEIGFDTVFNTNEEEIAVIINTSEFNENGIIAEEVYQDFENANDEDFYHLCMETICDRLGHVTGPIPDRAYKIWNIIEEEYL